MAREAAAQIHALMDATENVRVLDSVGVSVERERHSRGGWRRRWVGPWTDEENP